MTRALAEAWRMYEQLCVPDDADAEERRQIRRGFYSGMHVLLTILDTLAELPQPARDAACADVRAELATFQATLETRL